MTDPTTAIVPGGENASAAPLSVGRPCPVVYQPSGRLIGSASTEAGAKATAARVVGQLGPHERWSATHVVESFTHGTAWFVSPVMR